MNSAISYAEQPSVHDVLARKPVNDVVALNTYQVKRVLLAIEKLEVEHAAER
jgi:hypothetical protein